MRPWLAAAFAAGTLAAQMNTGRLEGVARDATGKLVAGASVVVTGPTGFSVTLRSSDDGSFHAVLPYGRYRVAGAEVFVPPLGIVTVGVAPGRERYPEALTLQGLLLGSQPVTVTEPLDFTGLSDNRRAVVSGRGFPWTATQFRLQGLDATDAYQPGEPVLLPDVFALEAVVARSPAGYGFEAGAYLAEARAAWHAGLLTIGTGTGLASSDLPPASELGLVRQADRFRWLTRDRAEIGGPLGARVDVYASASGQWGAQLEPLQAPGTEQRSRLLFGNARGRVRATAVDRFEAVYSGSRVDLSDGGIPAGLEALAGNRLMPSFVLPGGFAGQPETDHLDSAQVGWTRMIRGGAIEARYGYTVAHLDTRTLPQGQSRVELTGGAASGAPPLANRAVRPRHQLAASWQTGGRHGHFFTVGGGWETSESRNRFSAPVAGDGITAAGAPASLVVFETGVDARARTSSWTGHVADHIQWRRGLSFDVAAVGEAARGSAAGQTAIAWNSVSPRAGFAWLVPHGRGLALRGAYSRLVAPLAGRYLDFANPNSLGGSVYRNGAERGALLLHFGGPYSSVAPGLGRPYADLFEAGANARMGPLGAARITLFRRDEKQRIAAMDAGVPWQAFTPVSIRDPGPDGVAGTYDDAPLTVYAQDPATLGRDRYVLGNPPGLRDLNSGFVAEVESGWRALRIRASFMAVKSYGPTNPGDAVFANDPGVIGALYLDPNTAVHAAGRSFMDRAFVGKVQGLYRLPRAWGGVEVASVAGYTDGLVFARQLLVTGLPQGPIVIPATVRGSPEGGNRAQYVLDWNVRVSREFRAAAGRVRAWVDLMNVLNARQRVQEIDTSGPAFNQRLPVALQPPRFARIGLRYEF